MYNWLVRKVCLIVNNNQDSIRVVSVSLWILSWWYNITSDLIGTTYKQINLITNQRRIRRNKTSNVNPVNKAIYFSFYVVNTTTDWNLHIPNIGTILSLCNLLSICTQFMQWNSAKHACVIDKSDLFSCVVERFTFFRT